MKFLVTLFLTFFALTLNAQTANKIIDGDIFPNIRYDKNFVVNSEAERNVTTGVSSTMTTSRTALAANVISGQYSYSHVTSAASQTFTVSSTALPVGLNGQTCEGSFYYRFGSLTIPFTASVLSGTTEIASGTLVNTGLVSDTVKHIMTYPCVGDVKPSIKITSTASSALTLFTDKYYTGVYLNLTASGTGSSGVSLPTGELITSGTAEFGNPFVGYTTSGTAKPTTSGTVGAVSLTAIVSSTAPLDGANSFIITKASGNALGQQVRIPFNVPNAGFARAHTITMDYQNVSGLFEAGYVSGTSIIPSSLIPYILDHSTNTYIEPSSYLFSASSTTIADQFQASFQTSSSGTSYSLVLHQATSNTAAYSWKVDNISVNPNKYVFGTPFSDEQPYTPTITGFGTVTGVEFYFTRSGDKTLIRGRFVAGTPTAVEGQVTLPNGQVSKATTNNIIVGYAARSATSSQHFSVISKPSVNYLSFGGNNGGTAGTAPTNGNAIAGAGDTVSFFAEVTIQGQSSSVQMADQTSTKVIAANVYRNGAQSFPNGITTKVTLNAVTTDKSGIFSVANSRVDILVAGTYEVYGQVTFATNSANDRQANIYKNGINVAITNIKSSATIETTASVKTTLDLIAGDYLELHGLQNSGGALNIVGTSDATYLTVTKVSGPNQIAASDNVAAAYYLSASGAFGAGVVINFDSREFDRTGAVTTGAAWKFIAPISGVYEVTGAFNTGAAANNIAIYKNGSIYKTIGGYSNSAQEYGVYSGLVYLNGGDFIDLRLSNGGTLVGGNIPSAAGSTIHIKRTGF